MVTLNVIFMFLFFFIGSWILFVRKEEVLGTLYMILVFITAQGLHIRDTHEKVEYIYDVFQHLDAQMESQDDLP